MTMTFQNIQTKRSGLRCLIRVMNNSGDDVLTTYAPEVENSVAIATKDLQDFWNQCIDEFSKGGSSSLKPIVAGKRCGETEFELITNIPTPEFDLSIFEEILIQPVPLVGG